ncbi:MAG: glycosyltransferase family 9 protein [Hydrogenophilales bacterium]|nr:glycosyltransferase family 9 protein [Hydrogenophilales bacterium]
MSTALKILVIRRDNIGDLVCTTPVFTALRQRFPTAQICALVNSYNAPVLAHHPDVDRVFVYTKLKHRAPGQSRLRLLWQRLRMHQDLKKIAFDYVLLPNDQSRLLRFALGLRAKHVIALGHSTFQHQSLTMLPAIHEGSEHEAQAVFRLLEPLCIHGLPPHGLVIADPIDAAKAQAALDAKGGVGPVIALHISARKPSQRWSSERFAALMRELHARHGFRFILLWAPGSESNPHHPGDDEKAQTILQAASDLPVLPYPTHTLPELIGALSICDRVICSDGGTMHLAAGLGKPIVCLFGKSDAWRWHPWGVPYKLLQAGSKDVKDITVDEVINAFEQLASPIQHH